MFCPPPMPIIGGTRNPSPSSRTADRSYAIDRYVVLVLPETIAMVFELRLSPSGPKSGLLGSGAPVGLRRCWAAAGSAINDAVSSAARNDTSAKAVRDRDGP